MDEKWIKRDKKLKRRRDSKSVRKAMEFQEPRRKRHRRKSSADLIWDLREAQNSEGNTI